MQEAILFTIFLFGGWLGLIALYIIGKIMEHFMKKYIRLKNTVKKRRAYVDKLEAENRELRGRLLFLENEMEITSEETNN